MRRRDVLRRAAAVGALVAAAGCVSERSVPRAGDGAGADGTTVATTDRRGDGTTRPTTRAGRTDTAGGTTDAGEESTPRETTDDPAQERSTETPEETPQQTPEETPEETPQQTPEETPEETPQRTPEETPEETPEQTPEQTPERTPDRDDGQGDDTSGDDSSADEGPTPEVAGSSIETTSTGCASGRTGSPTVTRASGVVRITGAIRAADPCHRAVLGTVSYDAGTDVLTVEVGVTPTDPTDPCVECVGIVNYEAVVEFDGGTPGSVDANEVSNAGGPGPSPT